MCCDTECWLHRKCMHGRCEQQLPYVLPGGSSNFACQHVMSRAGTQASSAAMPMLAMWPTERRTQCHQLPP